MKFKLSKAIVKNLKDEEAFWKVSEESNSIAEIVQHFALMKRGKQGIRKLVLMQFPQSGVIKVRLPFQKIKHPMNFKNNFLKFFYIGKNY